MRSNRTGKWKISIGKSYHFWLLLLWMVIGCGLRFAQLTSKPPWTDEFATLVFSLGNSYQTIPLNEMISIDVLLQPLHPNPDARIGDVVSLLLDRDNHPPLYFVLAHWWMQLFPPDGEYANLWAARSLPAIFGVLSIPAIYGLGKLTFRSRLVGQLSAAMMAVSPYGVFLAQEARHYTLAILCVIASLGCLTIAVRHLWKCRPLPLWLVFLWIFVNGLGLSVHYFFSLTLTAEAIALIVLLWQQFTKNKHRSFLSDFLAIWWRLALVVIGTISTGLVWIFATIPRGYGNGMTDWIRNDNSSFLAVISPIFQMIATWITMLSLLPVESSSLPIAIGSGVLMFGFFVWALPLLYRGSIGASKKESNRVGLWVSIVFFSSAIALFFILNYAFGIDITRGARYSFIYFPVVIVLLGVIFATCWQEKIYFQPPLTLPSCFFKTNLYLQKNNRIAVIIILLMAFLGSLTVCSNLGYQKYYRSDLLVSLIARKPSVPVLIATPHKSLVQTGEMMGIAWELQRQSIKKQISFILVHQEPENHSSLHLTLQTAIDRVPHPLDVWAINFEERLSLNSCVADDTQYSQINGYNYRLYHCS